MRIMQMDLSELLDSEKVEELLGDDNEEVMETRRIAKKCYEEASRKKLMIYRYEQATK